MTRLLVLGAHPDDAEFFAGGFIAKHASMRSKIKLISVTNGQSGHQSIASNELIDIRRNEAARAGMIVGAEYLTWNFPDGSLTPSLEVRHAIIREMRQFKPDLVLTHRPFDYHPDHRAVGQAVQDASYLVMVPKIVDDVPPPPKEPIVAYMVDLFTRPCPFRADVVMDVSAQLDSLLAMLDCHRSQVYDWLPWIENVLDQVPEEEPHRRDWLRNWFFEKSAPRLERFWKPEYGPTPRLIEAFEVSEYAGKPSESMLDQLFPGRRCLKDG